MEPVHIDEMYMSFAFDSYFRLKIKLVTKYQTGQWFWVEHC